MICAIKNILKNPIKPSIAVNRKRKIINPNQITTIHSLGPINRNRGLNYNKHMAIEKPTYEVLRKDGRFEIRQYDPYITSEVTVSAENHRQAASLGFRPLANFIFGGNTSRQKIAMTAPVTAQPQSEKIAMTAPVAVSGQGEYTVSFTIPKKYTLDTLPIPDDDRVRFIEHPVQTFAAIRFSGPFAQSNFDRQIKKLRVWMAENDLSAIGEPIIAGYNAPITPNFLKHNEILIQTS